MAKFVVKTFGFEVDTTGEKFPDVQDMEDELSTYVQTLKNLEIASQVGLGMPSVSSRAS